MPARRSGRDHQPGSRRADLAGPNQRVVKFRNGRGTAEKWIREGKNTLRWARQSCQAFRHDAAWRQLHALACNLAKFMRALALPVQVEHWSLTTASEKPVKICARIVRLGRDVVVQLAEVTMPRRLLNQILQRIDRLRPQSPPLPA
jgi:hypothetical protein